MPTFISAFFRLFKMAFFIIIFHFEIPSFIPFRSVNSLTPCRKKLRFGAPFQGGRDDKDTVIFRDMYSPTGLEEPSAAGGDSAPRLVGTGDGVSWGFCLVSLMPAGSFLSAPSPRSSGFSLGGDPRERALPWVEAFEPSMSPAARERRQGLTARPSGGGHNGDADSITQRQGTCGYVPVLRAQS